MKNETKNRPNAMSVLCRTGAVFAILACQQLAQATDYSWHTASDGVFSAPDNWSPTGAPDGNDDKAIFGVPGEYAVEFTAMPTDPFIVNKSFDVSAGTVAFDLVFTILGSEIGVTYRLEPPSSMFTMAARVGTTAGSPARLIVAGGEDGRWGTVEAEGILAIGVAPGSEGQVDIGDPDPWVLQGDADWISTYPTWVGMNGAGTLIVNSGTLTDGGAVIGLFEDSQGTATVDHGAHWTNHGGLTVGQSGTGVLDIHSTTITDDNAYIGRLEGSDGTVSVDWDSWDIGGNLYVGGGDQEAGGTASLNVIGSTLSTPDVNVAGSAVIWPAGQVSIDEGGTLSVGDTLSTHPGSQISLVDGALEIGAIVGFDTTALNWTGGEVNITYGGLNIDVDEPFGQYLSLFGSKSLSVGGSLNVGPDSNGVLSVTAGGTVTSGSATIGSLSEDMLQGVGVVSGADSSWTIAGDLHIRGYQDALLSIGHGGTVTSHNAYLAAQQGSRALVTLDGASGDVLWDCVGNLYAGGSESDSWGTSTIQVGTGAQLNVAGTMKVWDDSVVEIDDGRVVAHDLDIAGEVILLNAGVLDVCDGALDIDNGGSLHGAVTGDSWTDVGLHENSTSWSMPGSLEVAASNAGVGHVGALTVGTGAIVNVDENVTVHEGTRLAMTGGTINAATIDLLDADFSGFGELNGDFSTTGSVTAMGTLTVGDLDSYSGVQIGGALNVGPYQVTINKNGAFTLGNLTSIAGGTLVAPNGVVLPTGNNLVVNGAIAARVTTQAGSTIEADGDLSLGDPNSPIGFVAEGDLVVGANTVTIDDSDGAALGPITSLGSNGPGTLSAANGLVLADQDTVMGQGLIDTPDDPTKPLANAGAIMGDSATERIELTGYVKGVGTLDNVTITGTDDPGDIGPVAVSRGNVDYAGKLVIEIGGLFAGTQHDQITHSGTAGLGGELTVELIAGFEPSLGDSFTNLVYADYTGQFDALSLPELPAGLEWDIAYGTSDVTLEVVEQGAGDCDLDNDGDTDFDDLNILLASYGSDAGGDLDGDSDTDFDDLNILLACYGS